MSREAGPLAVVAAERLRGATATRCAQQDVREHSATRQLDAYAIHRFLLPVPRHRGGGRGLSGNL